MCSVSHDFLARAVMTAALVASAACGGGSTPTSPSGSAPIPAAQACDAVGTLTSTFDASLAILAGAECSMDRGPVVKLNMHDAFNSLGTCSGTIIGPRAVLTAAHCLDGGVETVRVWLGVGPEFVAASFFTHPSFNTSTLQFDAGIVLMREDLPRPPASILTSRTGRPGETAIIAGFGRDEASVTTQLRAGSTTVSAANENRLETLYALPASAICSGDSGGPIFLSEGGRWVVAGISSATTESSCNTGTNYYQSVVRDSVRDFILQHVPAVVRR